jgi:hypothetical protein
MFKVHPPHNVNKQQLGSVLRARKVALLPFIFTHSAVLN